MRKHLFHTAFSNNWCRNNTTCVKKNDSLKVCNGNGERRWSWRPMNKIVHYVVGDSLLENTESCSKQWFSMSSIPSLPVVKASSVLICPLSLNPGTIYPPKIQPIHRWEVCEEDFPVMFPQSVICSVHVKRGLPNISLNCCSSNYETGTSCMLNQHLTVK